MKIQSFKKKKGVFMDRDVFSELKCELRSFHPDDGHAASQMRMEQLEKRQKHMEQFAAEHPEADALDFRKEIYRFMPEDWVPVIFPESPFYGETGGNGGWNRTGIGDWVFNHLREKIMIEPAGKIRKRFFSRNGNALYVGGSFFDNAHNNPAICHLLKTGYKGIYEETMHTLDECRTPEERKWCETAVAGLECIRKISIRYGEEARKRLSSAKNEMERRCMQRIVDSAFRVPWEAPRTFYEALNLCLFEREVVSELEGMRFNSLGRPDAWLIDFYRADLAAGRLTKDEAYDLICRFLLMADCAYDRDSKADLIITHENENALTLGGCDAHGKEVFNELTEIFLKAYRDLNLIFPKPHCRYSKNSSSEYLRLIGDDILSGRGIYSLLNDDCIIPALVKSGHTLEDARNYGCTGCWDLNIDSCEDNSGSHFFNLAKVMEITIHYTDERCNELGLEFLPKRMDDAQNFEEVYAAIMGNTLSILQDYLQDMSENGGRKALCAPAPAHSACCFDCLKKRKDYAAGGQRYNPHAVALSFFATYLDSLLALRDLCFERKICSVRKFLDAVRNNWRGAETLRQQVLKAPHWGDGREETISLARRITDDLLKKVESIKNCYGEGYQLGIWIYREIMRWGKTTLATPDGRYNADELSQSLNPSHFRNHEPLTTVLNCISRIDLTRFAGNSVTNLCIERENFNSDTVEALIRSFAALNLQLLQLNCMSSKDLEDAQKHPEKYPNLIVRICGFSAKFVSLCPEWQEEIIQRRKY